MNEPAFTDMPALVQALGAAFAACTDRPYALFGHSMGAGVAFELCRYLRRRGLPLPVKLIVSGARAPRYRLGLQPKRAPSDEELLDILQRLEGTPKEALASEELVRMLLPVLRADTTLYRNYVYVPEAPLEIPISAFGGVEDPNVPVEGLEEWRAETSAGEFAVRLFAGGHFYLNSDRDAVFKAIREELKWPDVDVRRGSGDPPS